MQNKSFNTTDTISVQATITDNVQLKYVEVSVLHSDFTTTGRITRYEASGSVFNLNVAFELELPALPSGNYYLAIRAFDGENTGSSYVSLYLHAVPLAVERTYVVTAVENQFSLYRKGATQGNFEQQFHFLSGFGGAAISPVQNVFLLAGSTVSDAVFYHSENLVSFASIPNLGNGSFDFFRGAKYTPYGFFYLMQDNGLVQVFDEQGLPYNSFFSVEGFRVVDVFEDDYSVFSFETGVAAPLKALVVRTKNGTLKWQYPLDGELKCVAQRNLNEFYFWTAGSQGYSLKIFHRNSGFAETVFTSASGSELKAVFSEGEGNFLIATTTGINRYVYGQGTTIFAAGIDAEAIYRNKADGTYYCTSGNEITILNTQGFVVDQLLFANPIRKVMFDYNR